MAENKSETPLEQSSTTGALPLDVGLGPSLASVNAPTHTSIVDARVLFISALAITVAAAATLIAQLLIRLIYFATNVFFFGRFSFARVAPWDNHLGWWVVAIPVIGGLIVGVMAR